MEPKAKILLVDDDPDILDTMSVVLTSHEYTVITARDGLDGLAKLRTEKPDLMILDLMMPKMDGLTACHMIKNDPATKSIPVIMVTAIGFELNVKLSQQMGASGYVTKPFSSEDLLGKITQVLAPV